jgi:galactose mutarotase-like enzyme
MIVELNNRVISASINTFGAELTALKKENTNYIWTIDEKYWNKTSPVLFPIVGRLKNDTYKIEEKEYHLTRHGFSRDCAFELVHKTETSATFSLQESVSTLEKYPFQFELLIEYVLLENQLVINYTVINNSVNNMPFNIGTHPAFAIPNTLEDYSLLFNASENFETHELENDLFSGTKRKIQSKNNIIELNEKLFEKDALVFKNIQSNAITVLHNEKAYLKIEFENFPFLGIWKKENAPFLCIEPWTGYADIVEATGFIYEKKDVQILDSKEAFNCKLAITL